MSLSGWGSLLVVGDGHGEEKRLEKTLARVGARCRMALLVGDLGVDPPWGRDRERAREAHDASVRRVIERVSDVVEGPVLFVPGNHDLPDPPEEVSAFNVDGRIVDDSGVVENSGEFA